MLKIPLLVSLGHHGGRRKVASSRPPFSTPLRSLGEPDPETPFLVPIEHAPPLFVRIWEDKISLKIPPPPLCFDFLILFSRNRQIPGLATGAVGHSLFFFFLSTVLIKVKIKKKKPTQLSTLSHTHDTAPQRDSSTHHTPLHHSKVHPPHAAGWRTKSKMTQ